MSKDMIKEQRTAIRTMTMGDWGLVKLGSMVFGILLAYLHPPLRYWVDWYIWVVLAFLIVVPVYYKWSHIKLSRNDIKKISGRGVGAKEWLQIKKSNSLWDWGLVKTCCMLLGIAFVSYYPQLIYQVPWYYVFGVFVVLMGLAMYLIYIYKMPKKTKKGNINWK